MRLYAPPHVARITVTEKEAVRFSNEEGRIEGSCVIGDDRNGEYEVFANGKFSMPFCRVFR